MKILIIGIVASGKTTLANKLSKSLNIKNYEIDSIVHDDIKKEKRSINEQLNIINDINKEKDWIIEGTLRKYLYFLLDRADEIVYIDIPLKERKKRIIKRYIKQKLKIEKTNYKPTLKMLQNMYKWTDDYEKNKGEFEQKLSNYKDKLIIINNTKDLTNYPKLKWGKV